MSPWVRRGVQIGFFLVVAFTVTAGALHERGIDVPVTGEGASLHAICPFGGVVSFWQLASAGTLVKKVHNSSVVLGVVALILGLLFGPVVCGWVCPMGSIQEWIGKLGRKLFGKRYNNLIPKKLDRVLRYLRYIVLILVSYMTIVTGKLAFQEADPYYALFNFWTGEVAVTAFAALAATLLLSLVVERPFCKYACPYGAFQGVFNLFRVFGIRRKASTCIACSACDKACPMNIVVSDKTVVRDHQCISCLECTSERSCPVPATVELALGSRETVDGESAAKVPSGGAETERGSK